MITQKTTHRPTEGGEQSGDWKHRFAQKLEMVRAATRDRFEHAAEQALDPTFKEFSEFTTRHHVRAGAPLSKLGIRTYKFAMTENTYLLMTFRHVGLQCEVQTECQVPGQGKLPTSCESIDLSELKVDWCRRGFEQALDRFLDTITGILGEQATPELETVPA